MTLPPTPRFRARSPGPRPTGRPAPLIVLPRAVGVPLSLLVMAWAAWGCAEGIGNDPQASGAATAPVPDALAEHQAFARGAVSGERARALVAAIDPSWRVPGNDAFNAAIEEVVKVLEEAGYVDEAEGGAGSLTYRVEEREMDRPTWEPLSASMGIVGEEEPLMELTTNLNLAAAYSFSTPAGGVEAGLVDVGEGSPEDFRGKEVEGKIVMGDASARRLFAAAVQERGALGVLAYRIPAFNHPEEHRDVAPMSSIPYDPEAEAWGLLLSRNARDALRRALDSGPVSVKVAVESRIYPAPELTLVAEARGESHPEERFVFSAHVQESGANDNASGVAVLAEIARALGEGVTTGAFRPRRTVAMLWGDEIRSTRRYMEEDPERAANVLWGLSLDMVGEDTEKTGGTFLIEKMPDPSAVWTRGEDRHTEWGGRPLTEEDLVPHYLNDVLLNRCRDQARETGWVVRTNPFEGGSDHVPFLRAGTPGVLFWHFTDVYYHTDGDRLDKVSAATLENVGVCSAVSAMTLTTADEPVAMHLIREVEEAALDRIATELELSRKAVAAGSEVGEERRILETWTRWYADALDTARDIQVGGSSDQTLRILEEAKTRVEEAGREAVADLEAGRS